MEVLAKIGVDWKLLLAQVVNFLVLLWVLRRFAYRPMLEFLEKRTKRIESGLRDAKLATQKLSEIEAKERGVLEEARKAGLYLWQRHRAARCGASGDAGG